MNGIIEAIIIAAQAAGVSSQLLLSVCFYESSLRNVTVENDGNGTSYGICMVKLDTARMFNPDVTAQDLMEPAQNALYAAQYLAHQIERYRGDTWCGVDAYNKGTAFFCPRVDNSRASVDNRYNTRYIKKVRQIMKTKPWMKAALRETAKAPSQGMTNNENK